METDLIALERKIKSIIDKIIAGLHHSQTNKEVFNGQIPALKTTSNVIGNIISSRIATEKNNLMREFLFKQQRIMADLKILAGLENPFEERTKIMSELYEFLEIADQILKISTRQAA